MIIRHIIDMSYSQHAFFLYKFILAEWVSTCPYRVARENMQSIALLECR